MQLRVARLCLDCEEIHDAQECPVCASEVFAYVSRWIPSPGGRKRPAPAAPPEAEAYREMTSPVRSPKAGRLRMIVPGMLGVGALGLAGWIWRGSSAARDRKSRGSA